MTNEPDSSRITNTAKKLNAAFAQGAENEYRKAWLAYQAAWNSTPGLPKLTNR